MGQRVTIKLDMEENKAVLPPEGTPEAAGTQEGNANPPEAEHSVDLKGLDEVITEVEKAADKVAKKNVILKQELSKRNRSEGEVLPDNDLALELDTVKKELDALKAQKELEGDAERKELELAKAKLGEYKASLIASKTSQKSVGAPNQDKLGPVSDPAKSVSPEVLPTLQSYAAQYKLPLQEIVRANEEADRLGQPLGLYLRRLK